MGRKSGLKYSMARAVSLVGAVLIPAALMACQASFQAGSGANQQPPPPPPPPPPSAPAAPAEPKTPPSQPGQDESASQDTQSDQGTAGEDAAKPTSAVKVKRGRVEVPGNVVFETGKATLAADSGSEAVLQQLKDFLDGNQQITKLRIEGHTDNVGDPEANLELSGQRSLTIKKWLVDKGIDSNRLLAVGFGEQRPIADNSTEEGRAQNRRTEFHLAEIYGKKYLGKDPTRGGKVFE